MDKHPSHEAFFTARPLDAGTLVVLTGAWTIFNLPVLQQTADKIAAQFSDRPLTIDVTRVERLDTAGARLLQPLLRSARVSLHLSDRQQALLSFLPEEQSTPEKQTKPALPVRLFADIGRATLAALSFTYELLCFIGQISLRFLANFARPRHFRFASIVRHVDETGIRAVPIVALLSFLMSMVIAYQGSIQLNKFGASVFTIDLTVISLLREMGVLITAIMVAGRSGSAFAAEIGVMKLREEVDALKTIGMDPIEVLVLPRLVALLITLPVLTFIADFVGIAGGALMSVTMLDIPLDQYMTRAQTVGTPTMFVVGMIKAPVFAFLIAAIGTYQGMNVSGSAESVGRLTTVAVVQSIFMVILTDAVFSIIFAKMGI